MKALGLLGQVVLPGEVASVPRVRHYVRDLLAAAGHAHHDDALLLVTELVTNAVRHSRSGRPGGRVTVAVADCDGMLHITVIDAGSADRRPRLRVEPDGAGGGGRGLWLVQELSAAWGWQEIPAGRAVWFQVPGVR